MYVRCCLVEIARKSVTETAMWEGRKVACVGLLFGVTAQVAASAMNVHG